MSKKSVSENIVYVIKLLNFQRYRVCHDAVIRKPKTEDKYNMNKQVQLFQQFHF